MAITSTFIIASIHASKGARNYSGNMIFIHQFPCYFTQPVQPLQTKAFFMAGNLKNTISRGVKNGLTRTHMLITQFGNNGSTGSMTVAQITGQIRSFYQFIQ